MLRFYITVVFFTGKVIPKDRVHPRLWKGSNRKFRFIPRQKNEIKKQNKVSAIVQTNRMAVKSQVSSLVITEYKVRKRAHI